MWHATLTLLQRRRRCRLHQRFKRAPFLRQWAPLLPFGSSLLFSQMDVNFVSVQVWGKKDPIPFVARNGCGLASLLPTSSIWLIAGGWLDGWVGRWLGWLRLDIFGEGTKTINQARIKTLRDKRAIGFSSCSIYVFFRILVKFVA